MPRKKKAASLTRKAAGRNAKKAVKPQAPKKSTKSAGASRAAGIKLFNLAGRPTREQFILVYGDAGPTMTWTERAKAGVSARQFQSVLAAKQPGR